MEKCLQTERPEQLFRCLHSFVFLDKLLDYNPARSEFLHFWMCAELTGMVAELYWSPIPAQWHGKGKPVTGGHNV